MKRIILSVFLALSTSLCALAQSKAAQQLYEQGKNYYDQKIYWEANDCFLKAAAEGHAMAMYYLGYITQKRLVNRNGSEGKDAYKQRIAKANEWYLKAAEAGADKAQCVVAKWHATGQNGMKGGYEEADRWYRKAALQGDKESQYEYGMFLSDKKIAAEWLLKAAKQGHAKAQFALSGLYQHGKGVKQDYKEAIKWLTASAENGYHEAQIALALMYYEGEIVKQDYALALKWYLAPGEMGNTNYNSRLGEMYEKGLGTNVDYAEAERWYSKDLNSFFAETAQENVNRVRAAAAAQKKAAAQQTAVEPKKPVVQQKTVEPKKPEAPKATETPKTALESNKPVESKNHLLHFTDDQPANATIYDLVDHVFGCVDMEMKQLTKQSVYDYMKEHYGLNMNINILSVVYGNVDKKYNVKISGRLINLLQFYDSGDYDKTWLYIISEKKKVLPFDECRRIIYGCKADLERVGYSFKVEKNKKNELEFVGKNNHKTVSLSCRAGSLSSIDIRVNEDHR